MQEAVLKSFSVDNCLQSLSSEEEARALVDKLQVLLADGGFELHQWASNRPAVISHLPSAVGSNSSELWIAQGPGVSPQPSVALPIRYSVLQAQKPDLPPDHSTHHLQDISKPIQPHWLPGALYHKS